MRRWRVYLGVAPSTAPAAPLIFAPVSAAIQTTVDNPTRRFAVCHKARSIQQSPHQYHLFILLPDGRSPGGIFTITASSAMARGSGTTESDLHAEQQAFRLLHGLHIWHYPPGTVAVPK